MAASKVAASDGLRIAYHVEGGGPPIVFLHGVGATKKMWAPQMAMLSERFRCIAIDYRGYGESEPPPESSLKADARDAKAISRAAYARDVIAVLDAEGIDAAHLCGCSLGGVVALRLLGVETCYVSPLPAGAGTAVRAGRGPWPEAGPGVPEWRAWRGPTSRPSGPPAARPRCRGHSHFCPGHSSPAWCSSATAVVPVPSWVIVIG